MLTNVDRKANGGAQLLRLREVAERLGVSPRQVERVAAASLMPPCVRVGRARRWRTSEIDDWLRAGCPPMADWRWPNEGGET